MKIIGNKKVRTLTFDVSNELLDHGVRFNDEMKRMPTGNMGLIKKGLSFPYSSGGQTPSGWCAGWDDGKDRHRKSTAWLNIPARHRLMIWRCYQASNQQAAEYFLIGGYALFAQGFHSRKNV